MAQTNPPATVASNAQLGLGSEVHHLPTREELRSYADDADQHCDRWVPLSPASLRAMADEFDRQEAEIDRLFGIGVELLIARRERDELREQRDDLRRALEVIAVGDAQNPQRQAAEELIALGYWRDIPKARVTPNV